jgi:hypothetical protein
MRLMAVKSKQCASKKNKYYCPEVFLDAVADKLTTTADLFLDAELLSKFYYSVSFLSLILPRLSHTIISPCNTLLTAIIVPTRIRRPSWPLPLQS